MAQFTMNAEITLKANSAIKSIINFERNAKNSKKEFSLLGRTVTLDVKRMKKSLGLLAIVTGTFLGGIVAQSPHVRAELKKLEAHILLLNVAMGEQLQPTVAFFVDTLIFLIGLFLSLPEPIQQWITLTIALTAAITAAIGVVILLNAVSLPLILTILGIAAALAFLITFAPKIQKFGQGITQFALGVSQSLREMITFINFAILEFTGQLGLFGDIVGAITVLIVNAFLAVPFALVDMAATVVQIFGDLFDAIGALFQGDFGGVVDAIGNVFIRLVNLIIRTLNSFLIDPINSALRAVDRAAEKFGGDVNFRVPTISEVSSFQEGGTVRRDGLIFAHRGEEISSKTEARANRIRNNGGGLTINNYNTFKIGSVDNRQRIRDLVKEIDRASKRNNDRRFKV